MWRTSGEIGAQMKTTKVWILGLIMSALVVAACSSSSSIEGTEAGVSTTTTTTSEDGDGIRIKDFAFGPEELFVSVGETVTWTNDEEGIGHTTASDDGLWQSDTLNSGDTFEHTFDEAGVFTYFCSIHPSMTATVTVEG
jgi:plastocyanin